MSEWQVQRSRDGHTWIPMQPRADRPELSMDEGDHWFNSEEDAVIAGQHVRNAFTWSDVRVVERDESGRIVNDVPIV